MKAFTVFKAFFYSSGIGTGRVNHASLKKNLPPIENFSLYWVSSVGRSNAINLLIIFLFKNYGLKTEMEKKSFSSSGFWY